MVLQDVGTQVEESSGPPGAIGLPSLANVTDLLIIAPGSVQSLYI